MSSFSKFFSNVGHGLSSIAKPVLGAASSFAPMAGTMIGGALGGPSGAMMGGQLGGMAGGMMNQISGRGGQTQAPQMPSYQNFGSAGSQAGNYLNSMLPQGMQGMNLGQMGSSLAGHFGSGLESMLPQSMQGQGLGGMASNFLRGQLSSRIPQSYQNMNLGQMGSQAGGALYNRMSQAAPGYAEGGSVGYNDGGPMYAYGQPQIPYYS